MIKRVRLKNWKSHLESEFVFDKGVNALVGIMGSGKSSVIQAISFALYGTFPFIKSRKVGIEDMIMKRPQRMRFSEIELEMEIDGKEFSIKRRIEEGKGTTLAEIRKEGEILEVNPAGVTREVERILQMDYDLFSKAVYSEQNAMDYFLRLPRGSRIKQIDNMLHVDRFERAREAAVLLLNRIISRKEEASSILSGMETKGIEEKVKNASDNLCRLKEDSLGLEKRLEYLSKEKEEFSEKIEALTQKEEEMNTMQKDIEGLKSGIREIEETLGKKILLDKDSLKKEMGDVVKELEVMGLELEKHTHEMSKTREELASYNTEIKLVRDSMKNLLSAEAVCPVCESDISGTRKDDAIENKKVRENELAVKASGAGARFEAMQKELENLKVNIREKESLKERISRKMDEVGLLKGLEERKEEYQDRLAEVSKKESEIRKELEESDMGSLREMFQKKIAEVGMLSGRLENAGERIKQAEGYLAELRKREMEIKKIQNRISKDREIIEGLNGFVKVLRITQDQLRQEFLKTVNFIMNSVWKEIYPYGDFQGIRLIIDNDYVLQLKGMGDWVSVDGIVSGGERSLASLALRIAFSLAFIPNLRWLVLDEPTHNLDANSIDRFGEVLKEKMHSFTEQVFLITHEERIAESITGSLYRLDRNKEANEATKVVAM